MIVYRLSKKKYSADLSGRGAEKAGGRWNSKGLPMVYTSESRALCTTEIAVHSPLGNIPTDYYLTTIEIPAASILEIKQADLPKDWKAIPHSNSTQLIGDKFLSENKLMPKVLSNNSLGLTPPKTRFFVSIQKINFS